MTTQFFIYEVLGFPDGPLTLQAVPIPDVIYVYRSRSSKGFDSIEEAEKHLEFQETYENLQGDFVILPVYHLEMD